MIRWSTHCCATIALLLISVEPGFAAEAWRPLRPVAFVNGAAPGGSIDLTARVIQRIWDEQKLIGQPVIVINKPGAGNGIAWSYLNERGSDGHAISIGTTNLVSNPVTGAHAIGYRDVTLLALLFDDYATFIVRADSPLKSMRDVVERLRRDPASVSVAFAPSIGSGTHSAAIAMLKGAGINPRAARLVAYKSAPEAVTAVMGGDIDVAAATTANLPLLLPGGRVRVIGITSPHRLQGLVAHVPSLKEQGIDTVFTNWRAVIGPKGMRKEHIAYWEYAVAAAVGTDAWRKELDRYFWTPNYLTGEPLRRFVERSAQEFRALWADAGAS